MISKELTLEEVNELLQDYTPKLNGKLKHLMDSCEEDGFDHSNYDADYDHVLFTCHCSACKAFYKSPVYYEDDRSLICPACGYIYNKEDQVNFSYVYKNLFNDFLDHINDLYDEHIKLDSFIKSEIRSYISGYMETFFKFIGLKLFFNDGTNIVKKYTISL